MKAYRRATIYTFKDGTQLLEEAGSLPSPSHNDEVAVGQKDQSLQDLSFRYFGDHESWVSIAYANGITDPWQDLTGINLIIPNIPNEN